MTSLVHSVKIIPDQILDIHRACQAKGWQGAREKVWEIAKLSLKLVAFIAVAAAIVSTLTIPFTVPLVSIGAAIGAALVTDAVIALLAYVALRFSDSPGQYGKEAIAS